MGNRESKSYWGAELPPNYEKSATAVSENKIFIFIPIK